VIGHGRGKEGEIAGSKNEVTGAIWSASILRGGEEGRGGGRKGKLVAGKDGGSYLSHPYPRGTEEKKRGLFR